MKKTILPIMLLSLLTFSCSHERTTDQITADVAKTRKQITELNAKLTALEQELAVKQPVKELNLIKVEVDTVQRTSFTDYIQSNGIVEAVKSASISPDMGGKIESIPVKIGQSVRKGQLLMSLDSKVMQSSISEMEKGLELTTTLFNKQKGLWDQGIGSEVQFLEIRNRKESMEQTLKTLKSQLDLTRIHAPFDGRIEKISMKVGELASPGRGIIDLVNLSSLFENTEVSEKFMQTVNKGDTVTIEFPNLPGVVKTIPVAYTGNVINPQSRTFTVRLEIPNTAQEIKPNMLAKVKIRIIGLRDAVVVPTALIRQDVEGSYVFIVQNAGSTPVARKVYLKTGSSDGNLTVINEGLSGGEVIISQGYNRIKDGSPVSVSNQSVN
ncbi:MAG: efflux RND transporter periplasmic adaptor subunit [Bacteroidales bacterium]|nr:efflux RND transporter periplasmic adaptor subunit [Bacteroidales bacterium]